MTNRREFLFGSAALAGVGTFGAETVVKGTVPTGPVRLKFGVLADIHVTGNDATADNWEKALRKLDQFKVDGVLVCGDLADYGLDVQLEEVARRWFKVFPDNRRSDGEKVVNLLHYGDHDTSGYTYRNCTIKDWPDEAELKRHIIRNLDRKAVWEKCFKEPWAPIVKKTVKGYDFILAHFTKGEPGNSEGNNTPGLEEFLAKAGLDPRKPFFYSQHRIPRNTAAGPYAWGQEDGKTTALFSAKYPNCFTFCGHHHLTASEEQAIWQGGFTCVEVPSTLYNCSLAGRENSTHTEWDSYFKSPALTMTDQVGWGATKAALIVAVCDQAIIIRRWSLQDDAPIGPDWVVPLPLLGEKPYAHAYRAAHEPPPQFPATAKVTMKRVKGKDCQGVEQEFYELEFPMALEEGQRLRANDYEVKVELQRCDVILPVAAYRVFSPLYGRASAIDVKPVKCRVPVKAVPAPGFQRVRFAVTPVGSFGQKGKPIHFALSPA